MDGFLPANASTSNAALFEQLADLGVSFNHKAATQRPASWLWISGNQAEDVDRLRSFVATTPLPVVVLQPFARSLRIGPLFGADDYCCVDCFQRYSALFPTPATNDYLLALPAWQTAARWLNSHLAQLAARMLVIRADGSSQIGRLPRDPLCLRCSSFRSYPIDSLQQLHQASA